MFKRILVPVDLADETSTQRALAVAEDLAEKNAAELHVLTVVPAYSMSIVGSYFPEDHERETLQRAKDALADFTATRTTNVAIRGHVAKGTIYDEIMKVANKLEVNLIVMASHRPELKDYLLGPNAARVVRHAKQSVFVVRE